MLVFAGSVQLYVILYSNTLSASYFTTEDKGYCKVKVLSSPLSFKK